MRNPLHVQILQSLHLSVQERRELLRAKVGEGLEDREYQRHVGRIREASVLLEDIERYIANGLDTVESEEEETPS